MRARISHPAGWISLTKLGSDTRWAVHAEDYGKVQAAGAMPEASNVFANAAAVGCNPTALFQGVGSAGAIPAEVSDGEAWDAMAMLEKQLSRADDPSEDDGSRQAANMLKTMVRVLTKSGDMPLMAQTMFPDLGKIWAKEGTREYLKSLLSSPAAGESCRPAVGSFSASSANTGSSSGFPAGGAGSSSAAPAGSAGSSSAFPAGSSSAFPAGGAGSSSSAAPAGSADSAGTGSAGASAEWPCPDCTLLNDSTTDVCGACGTRRGGDDETAGGGSASCGSGGAADSSSGGAADSSSGLRARVGSSSGGSASASAGN